MSSLTLTFRTAGEEVIVLKSLLEAYARCSLQVEELRTACPSEDLAGLLSLAAITDYIEERSAKLSRRWQRACGRMAQEEAEDTAEAEAA